MSKPTLRSLAPWFVIGSSIAAAAAVTALTQPSRSRGAPVEQPRSEPARPVETRTGIPKPAPATRAIATNPVSVKFMLRGYCYAGSKVKDKDALGGFGTSKNLPVAIPRDLSARPGAVSLHVALDEPAKFDKHDGLALYLVNTTGKRVAFAASDSRLYIVQEARDAAGAWRPVEYLPSSFCGNSYHRVFLDPDQCWRFVAPRYAGPIKTKLRFALQGTEGETIHSNEFDGSVHPEQFTQKQGHTPNNIMDPYLD